jgi:16S rRNA C967 or C1407 C5-methylase (RsmB/RsmF family)
MKTISIENLRSESGITEWNNESYNSEVKKCMRVWPHHNDTDAFFIARMEKY